MSNQISAVQSSTGWAEHMKAILRLHVCSISLAQYEWSKPGHCTYPPLYLHICSIAWSTPNPLTGIPFEELEKGKRYIEDILLCIKL